MTQPRSGKPKFTPDVCYFLPGDCPRRLLIASENVLACGARFCTPAAMATSTSSVTPAWIQVLRKSLPAQFSTTSMRESRRTISRQTPSQTQPPAAAEGHPSGRINRRRQKPGAWQRSRRSVRKAWPAPFGPSERACARPWCALPHSLGWPARGRFPAPVEFTHRVSVSKTRPAGPVQRLRCFR